MIDLNIFVDDARENMERAVEHLTEQLSRVRAGKANPKILDGIFVEYYGNNTPLNQVATVTTPDARTIVVAPWEKNLLKEIEKAIINSPVGITPENNGEVIRLGIPPLTEDRRRDLVKQVKSDAEEAKISVRNARRDAIEAVRKSIKTDSVPEDAAKDTEAKIQTVHDKYIKRIEEVFGDKEKEIMTV
ncbi:ribosome recycling factor [Porphyromonas macacae]|uniref:ribosome recycling factor n=1 Tax=Porphyromonas macacae TaxID=28115 RepID=UPI0035A177CB